MYQLLNRILGRCVEDEPSTAGSSDVPETPIVKTIEGPAASAEHPTNSAHDQAPASANPERDTTIAVELRHFLHRIPKVLLKDEGIDESISLRFEPSEIGRCLANGITTIPLAEVYRRVPGIFREALSESDDTSIRFPWQMIGTLAPHVAAAVSKSTDAAFVETLRDRALSNGAMPPPATAKTDTRPANGKSGPVVNGVVKPSWYSPKPVIENPTPIAPSEESDVPSGALAEGPMTRKSGAKPDLIPFVPLRVTAPKPAVEPPVEPPVEAPMEDARKKQAALQVSEEMAEQLANFKREQTEQLAALSQGRVALEAEWAKALAELERTRAELAEKNRDLQAQLPGVRTSTRQHVEEQAKRMPELDRLIHGSLSRLSESERERDGLLAFKSHMSGLFEELCLARQDFETLQLECDGKDREVAGLFELAEAANGKLLAATAEIETLKSENAGLMEQIGLLTAAAEEAGELARKRDELLARIEELEHCVATGEVARTEAAQALDREREARSEADRRAAEAEAQAELSVEEVRAEADRQAEEAAKQAELSLGKARADAERFLEVQAEGFAQREEEYRRQLAALTGSAAEEIALREMACEDLRILGIESADKLERTVARVEAERATAARGIAARERLRAQVTRRLREQATRDRKQLVAKLARCRPKRRAIAANARQSKEKKPALFARLARAFAPAGSRPKTRELSPSH